MRGVAVQLPGPAQNKLQELSIACDASLDAARAANSRLQSLPRDADRLKARLAAERDKHNAKHATLSRLLNAARQWISELRPNTVLEVTPPIDVALKPDEKLLDVIQAVRSEIKAVRERLDATKRAGLPRDDLKKLAESYVLQLALQARPRIAVVNDQLRVSWRGDTAMVEDVAALFAFLSPDLLCAALQREIDQLPTRSDALSADQRKRRVAELEAALDKLERAEQALLDRAHEDGLDVLPRPDAAPSAVLGVIAVANKAKTEAAA